ncbi:4-phosphoerythronate dehydrogenase [Luminiphilus sp. nBUS_16]|uniref:4-phosphoerythronate dehydrogenase n=1 Tax=Luminiphilus sp. nBUS_16 TaxID=3395315 RepID=UPI003EBE7017
MGYRIVADENIQITPELLSLSTSLKTLAGREINPSHLVDADVLLVRSVTQVTPALLGQSSVVFVGSATAGVEHVDTEYLKSRDIQFSAAPGANANAVTEYVCSVLAARGRLAEILMGATVGIVGYGHVGQQLARVILALGGNVAVWDPWETVPADIKSPSLEFVLQQNIVTVHAALHGQSPWPSRAMIDAPLPSKMPAGQLFINAARGELVTEAALQAFAENSADIVLDVWPDEPSVSAAQLAMVSVGTAHIAGYTLGAKVRATNMLVHALTGKRFGGEISAASPIDMSAVLEAPELPEAAWLTRLLLASYDPNNDCAELSKVCVPAVVPRDFDRLRRNYKLRQELRGRPVLMPPNCSDRLNRLVVALGALPMRAQ